VQAIDSVKGDDQSDTNIPEIQSLLSDYVHLFDKPVGLPPSRSADHKIPLVPGAQPVKARPYRYTPQQKDEIEAQVREML
jgi:hypothetical protein